MTIRSAPQISTLDAVPKGYRSSVLDEEGNAGDAWYEEDDAFEYIVDYIAEKNHFNPDQAVAAAMVVNDFMELQAQYMEKKGLVTYEGE